jgi:hypothetical protein
MPIRSLTASRNRCLHRDVPQQGLDLFQFAAGSVTESGARPPQIVRRELRDCQFLCVHSNDVLRLHRNRYDGLDLLAFTRARDTETKILSDAGVLTFRSTWTYRYLGLMK